jgi:hypothetical protein
MAAGCNLHRRGIAEIDDEPATNAWSLPTGAARTKKSR